MSNQFFDRVYKVTVGPKGNAGISFSDLKIDFKVKKTMKPHGNTCSVEVYNLAPTTRAQLSATSKNILILEAGYTKNIGPELVYVGDVARIYHRYKTPDIITTIECNDGDEFFKTSISSVSYKENVDGMKIFNDVVKQTGQTLKTAGNPLDFIKKTFTNGFSFVGKTSKLLDNLGDDVGGDWSFQNGEIKFVPVNKTDGTTFLLSPESGMIGSPEKSKIKVGKNEVDGWVIKNLLLPMVEPCNLVEIESRDIKRGSFKVIDVAHNGDYFGAEWCSTFEVIEA